MPVKYRDFIAIISISAKPHISLAILQDGEDLIATESIVDGEVLKSEIGRLSEECSRGYREYCEELTKLRYKVHRTPHTNVVPI